MTHLEEKLIEQARLVIPNCCEGRCKHASFLCVRNKIISIGTNSYRKMSTLAKRFGHRGAYIHAELGAIINANRNIDFSRMTMYNVRIDLSGNIRLSKPCVHCQKLLIAFNIRRCYFTNDGGEFERFF
jgi:deoxycytidylate deaminase